MPTYEYECKQCQHEFEAFQSMKKKPKRTIVFAWVTAEEKGLIGSNYYTQHPIIPLENTLANINLDMVGRSA